MFVEPLSPLHNSFFEVRLQAVPGGQQGLGYFVGFLMSLVSNMACRAFMWAMKKQPFFRQLL